ncbi:MAG: OmpA family protein [Acidobacteriota bacterium]|nr:OmpA family protein [Blastocatellia bacterium]MDW8411304.1 OmpA family protein [Acidobacteriota bacterium]
MKQLILIVLAFALTSQAQEIERVRSIPQGEKVKLKGLIMHRDGDTLTVRDRTGVDTIVELSEYTSVKSKGGFLRSGKNYDVTSLIVGLVIEVEGLGNDKGWLAAQKIRFDKNDLKMANAADARVRPVEDRVGRVEGEVGRLSGRVDQLGENVEATNRRIDETNQRLDETNERIFAMDDYEVLENVVVYFPVNVYTLDAQAQAELDRLAERAASTRGYLIEVTGYTDSTGSYEKNRELSQRRADSVVRYLSERHNIPLRRIVTPLGLADARAVADNRTPEGRRLNRRVEVKLLLSRGYR